MERGTDSGALIQANSASALEAAARQGLGEEDARRLVADARLDAGLAPHALQHLLHRFARAVAGGGHEFERQALAGGVAADAVGAGRPAGLVQQRARRGRGRRAMAQHIRVVHRVERVDARYAPPAAARRTGVRRSARGRSPAAAPGARGGRTARHGRGAGPVLVDQAGLVEEAEAVAGAAFQRDGLFDRQAEFAGDHVDLPGEQLRFQRRRVLDRADGDAAEVRARRRSRRGCGRA